MNISLPKPHENTWLWLLKLVTGVLVFALIVIHIIVNHLVAQGGLLTYAQVVAYLSTPGIAFMEGSFLVIVISHSLLGTRSVILDLHPSPRLLRFLDIGFVVLGTAAAVYGIALLRVIVSRGA